MWAVFASLLVFRAREASSGVAAQVPAWSASLRSVMVTEPSLPTAPVELGRLFRCLSSVCGLVLFVSTRDVSVVLDESIPVF